MAFNGSRLGIRLRPSIVALFLVLAIPLFVATVWIGYVTNDRIARDTADALVEKARFETFNSTIELLEPIKTMVKIAARLGDLQPDFFREDASAAYLMEMLSNNEHIDSAYVAMVDGSFRMNLKVRPGARILNEEVPAPARSAQRWLDRKGTADPQDHYFFFDAEGKPAGVRSAAAVYDPRVRPWFKESLAAGNRLSISDPYIFATTGLAGITVSMPFYAQGQPAGVVAVDITLDHLSVFLKSRPVSPGSISLIIDENDRIVAHPDPAESVRREDGKLIQNNLSRLSSDLPGFAMASRPAQGSERFTFIHSKNGLEYVAMLSALPDSLGKSWRVMIVTPLADFSAVWTENNKKLLAFGALAIVIEVLLISLLSKLISRPIEQLESRIMDVQNFTTKPTPAIRSSIPEIQSLIRAVHALETTIGAFASFVPKGLVRKLMNSPQQLELGGHSRFLTIFFSDLESFSSLAESSPAQELLQRVSAYLEAVTLAVNEEQGTIDKFIGDGVMAFWGAPELLDDHAYRSCVASLKVLQRMEVLNAQWVQQGLAPLGIRIGIHSDSVLVGNIGSAERMSYTVMGDGVNLASRLEGVNKDFGTRICVSHSVFKEAGERLWLRPICEVNVKGRRAGMEIYELMGIRGAEPALEASEATVRLCEMTRVAYEAYRNADLQEAQRLYEAVLQAYPQDPVAAAMLTRCAQGSGPAKLAHA
jgi:adenylate cyclase